MKRNFFKAGNWYAQCYANGAVMTLRVINHVDGDKSYYDEFSPCGLDCDLSSPEYFLASKQEGSWRQLTKSQALRQIKDWQETLNYNFFGDDALD